MDTYVCRRARTYALSGGERQRISVARAICRDTQSRSCSSEGDNAALKPASAEKSRDGPHRSLNSAPDRTVIITRPPHLGLKAQTMINVVPAKGGMQEEERLWRGWSRTKICDTRAALCPCKAVKSRNITKAAASTSYWVAFRRVEALMSSGSPAIESVLHCCREVYSDLTPLVECAFNKLKSIRPK